LITEGASAAAEATEEPMQTDEAAAPTGTPSDQAPTAMEAQAEVNTPSLQEEGSQ